MKSSVPTAGRKVNRICRNSGCPSWRDAVALAEPVRLGDYAVVDAGCDAIWPVIRVQRWMLIVIGAKDSTGAFDSTASVRFGAPDERPQIKVPECDWYRIRTNVIDAEKANLT
jgi:hypothetical protein